MPRAQNLENLTFQYHWNKNPTMLHLFFAGFGMLLVGTLVTGMSHLLGSFVSIAIDPHHFNQWPPVGASSWLIIAGYAAIVLAIANIVRFAEKRYTGSSDLVIGLGLMLIPFLFAAIFQ